MKYKFPKVVAVKVTSTAGYTAKDEEIRDLIDGGSIIKVGYNRYSRGTYAGKKIYLYKSANEPCRTHEAMYAAMKDPAKGFSIPGFPLTLAEGDYVTVPGDPEYWQPSELEHLLALVRIRRYTTSLLDIIGKLVAIKGIEDDTTTKYVKSLQTVFNLADEAMEITAGNYKEL